MSEFETLLADVVGSNLERKKAAVERLKDWQPNARQGVAFIEAAAKVVGDSDQYETLASQLLDPCWKRPRKHFIEVVKQNYTEFCREREAQWRTMRILTELKSKQALKTFVELLQLPDSRRFSLEMPLIPLLGSFWGGRTPPPEVAVMFPAWFNLVDHLQDTYHVYSLNSQCQAVALIANVRVYAQRKPDVAMTGQSLCKFRRNACPLKVRNEEMPQGVEICEQPFVIPVAKEV